MRDTIRQRSEDIGAMLSNLRAVKGHGFTEVVVAAMCAGRVAEVLTIAVKPDIVPTIAPLLSPLVRQIADAYQVSDADLEEALRFAEQVLEKAWIRTK